MMHTFDRVRQDDGSYLYVVGWFDAANVWHPLRDCVSEADAAQWVSYLNGGERPVADW